METTIGMKLYREKKRLKALLLEAKIRWNEGFIYMKSPNSEPFSNGVLPHYFQSIGIVGSAPLAFESVSTVDYRVEVVNIFASEGSLEIQKTCGS